MPMNTRRSVIVLMIAAFGIKGCAIPYLAPTPDVRKVLAPTGTLRLGLFLGTPGQMIRNPSTGEVRGIGYELGRAFAKRQGVPFEVVLIQGTRSSLKQCNPAEWTSGHTTPLLRAQST